MISQAKDRCTNLVREIEMIDRSRLHWQGTLIRLAASARHELKNLRLAARVPGADRDELLALIARLGTELDQALENHEGRRSSWR